MCNLATNAVLCADAAPSTVTSPIVFVVDDDISILESLELLILSVGWHPELFASAGAFLSQPKPPCSALPDPRYQSSRPQRTEVAGIAFGKPKWNATYIRDRVRRRSDDCPGDESRGHRLLDEAFRE